jgi:hypothetical protein
MIALLFSCALFLFLVILDAIVLMKTGYNIYNPVSYFPFVPFFNSKRLDCYYDRNGSKYVCWWFRIPVKTYCHDGCMWFDSVRDLTSLILTYFRVCFYQLLFSSLLFAVQLISYTCGTLLQVPHRNLTIRLLGTRRKTYFSVIFGIFLFFTLTLSPRLNTVQQNTDELNRMLIDFSFCIFLYLLTISTYSWTSVSLLERESNGEENRFLQFLFWS